MSPLTSVVGDIGAVVTSSDNLARSVASIVSGAFLQRLRGASLGGVPFAVIEGTTTAGRRNAIHEYPFRDGVWVEDMGKQARRYDVSGFLVENSRAYGGGSIDRQRHAILDVVESNRPIQFVHPTLGIISNVSVLGFSMFDRLDLGGASEIRFTIVESGPSVFPAVIATPVIDGLSLELAAIADFALRTAAAIQNGSAVFQGAVNNSLLFGRVIDRAVLDVKRFWGSVSRLAGDFGRFFGGGNRGLGSNVLVSTSVSALISQNVARRAEVTAAAADLANADPSQPQDFAAAARALIVAATASAADPADALRIASLAAQFTPQTNSGVSPVSRAVATAQAATAALFRRIALAQLCRTASDYQPSSVDDAVVVRDRVIARLDSEIDIAGDAGDDQSYESLRALRQAVVRDFNDRADGLPRLKNWSFDAPLPSLVLAQRMYRDPSRADELVRQIAPVHPAFCDRYFQAPSA